MCKESKPSSAPESVKILSSAIAKGVMLACIVAVCVFMMLGDPLSVRGWGAKRDTSLGLFTIEGLLLFGLLLSLLIAYFRVHPRAKGCVLYFLVPVLLLACPLLPILVDFMKAVYQAFR
jgi:hypothetical protein